MRRRRPRSTRTDTLFPYPTLFRAQLGDVLRERVGPVEIAPQRAHRRLVGARRAAEPEVDPVRIQRRQGAELLGHLRRRVVGQRSEEHTSETPVTNAHLVCRLLLEKKNNTSSNNTTKTRTE